MPFIRDWANIRKIHDDDKTMIYILTIMPTLVMAYLYDKSGGCKIANNSQYCWKSINRIIKLNRNWLLMKLLFLIMILPVVLVSGLRYGISVDYINVYERGFYRLVGTDTTQSEFEIGFQVLVKICANIIDEPWCH